MTVVWLAVVSGITILRLFIGRSGAAVPISRLGAGRMPEGLTPVAHVYDVGLDLIGARVETDLVTADDELRIDLLWIARATPSAEYRTSILLVGREGRTWSPAGTLRPRGYEPPPPTMMWQPGEFVFDPHLVSPLPGTPPGTYDVVVGLFDRDTLEPATLFGPQGEPLGTELVLGEIEIVRPAVSPSLSDLGVSAPEPPSACDGIALWSMTLDRGSAAPGGLVAVRWVWEATGAPARVRLAEISLTDRDDEVLDSWLLPPVASWWPTDRWRVGDRWLGQHVLRLPGGLATGSYTFEARLEGCADPLARVALGVEAPERRWTVPDGLTTTDILFGDRIRLVGYRVDTAGVDSGETLTVSLAWQAVTELDKSYRIFVHLLDAEGRMIDQSDGVPVSWGRPTPGWAVGEVVVESRSVEVSDRAGSDAYTVRVGVYHEDGTRLATNLGGDGVILETIIPVEGQ